VPWSSNLIIRLITANVVIVHPRATGYKNDSCTNFCSWSNAVEHVQYVSGTRATPHNARPLAVSSRQWMRQLYRVNSDLTCERADASVKSRHAWPPYSLHGCSDLNHKSKESADVRMYRPCTEKLVAKKKKGLQTLALLLHSWAVSNSNLILETVYAVWSTHGLHRSLLR
jgi:hypothetical protein